MAHFYWLQCNICDSEKALESEEELQGTWYCDNSIAFVCQIKKRGSYGVTKFLLPALYLVL